MPLNEEDKDLIWNAAVFTVVFAAIYFLFKG